MSWEHFIWFAIAALICWGLGAFAAWEGKKPVWAYGFTLLGLAIFFSFILGMWISLERPPMRTMGETRLWYSFFLPLAGLITYVRWKYKWILSFSCILSLVFICINIFKPEIHNKTLMPALQSPWFAPHVHSVYVCLCDVGSCGGHGCLSALVQKRRILNGKRWTYAIT